MKIFKNTENPVPKQFKFTQQDLEIAMVDGVVPSVILQPFRNSNNSNLQKIKLKASLVNTNNNTPINIISDSLKCDSKIIKNLSFWIIKNIWEDFKLAIEEWSSFVKDNSEEVCKKSSSRSRWVLFCNSSRKDQSVILDEQKLWILYNDMLDKEDNINLIETVRDSIIPWINPKLWKDVENQKKFKHENVAYEKQKKTMVEADTKLPEDLDIIV